MKYKLLASDLDGTLLNRNTEITKRTRQTILKAKERGMIFVPATGRPLCGVKFVTDAFPGDYPVITYNGAVVVMSESRRVLFSQNLERKRAKEVYLLGCERGVPLIIWEGETLHVSRRCFETELYEKATGAQLNVLEDFERLSDITKIIWLVAAEDGRRLTLELGAHFAGKLNVHTSHPCLLEFVDARASKGLALAAIAETYGISSSEVIAVGDGFNDMSMLEYAGLSVAMQNAPEELKQICGYVACSNDEEGVAKVVERFVLS
jgi:hypothetical protein